MCCFLIFSFYICQNLKLSIMEISKDKKYENPNYLGYDEDHNGDWNDYFRCPNKECNEGYRNNYITTEMDECPICGEKLEWI